MIRWSFLVLAIAGLAVVAWTERLPIARTLGLTSPGQASPSPPPPRDDAKNDPDEIEVSADAAKGMGIATTRAETREIVRLIRAPGTVQFDERHVTYLKPRTRGRVLSLAVTPGDIVVAGQTLATLDASGVLDASNGLEAAQAALEEAKASEYAARVAVTRASALLKIGGIALAELQKRQVDEAKAVAVVKAAQSRLDLTKARYNQLAPVGGPNSGTTSIVTPIAGVVTTVGISLGEMVDSAGNAFVVADPARVIVQASLFGADMEAVKPYDIAHIATSFGPASQYEARVLSVGASLDPTTNTAPARIEVDNQDAQLKANMFVTVEIAADAHRMGTTIAAGALQQSEQGPIVFVRKDASHYERRKVQLGVQRADWLEVKAGVKPGEAVVTSGSFNLKAVLMRNLLGSTD